MADQDNLLSLAIVRYIGCGLEMFPSHYPDRVVSEFGPKLAARLIPKIEEILGELDKLSPDWSIHTIESAGNWLKEQAHIKYPELSHDAIKALWLRFTYVWSK